MGCLKKVIMLVEEMEVLPVVVMASEGGGGRQGLLVTREGTLWEETSYKPTCLSRVAFLQVIATWGNGSGQ